MPISGNSPQPVPGATRATGSSAVRPFRRSDREQLTDLVNLHARAVVPGLRLPVNTVLSQLEGEPGEFIVDRWVVERRALVAEQRGRIAAACLVVRYADDAAVGADYRGRVEIAWVLHVPDSPVWTDGSQAGRAVLAAALRFARERGADEVLADGRLPVGGVYGVPRQWPHIRSLLVDHGFGGADRREAGWAASVRRLAALDAVRPELTVTRSVGALGTVLTATEDGDRVGWIEVDDITVGQGVRCADIANLWVDPRSEGDGTVAGELIRRAARWLDAGGVELLLDYTDDGDETYAAMLRANGFEQIFETERGWRLSLAPDPAER